ERVSLPGARVGREHLRDGRVRVEELDVPALDDPGDDGAGPGGRGGDGQCVDDVAEGGETDDEEPHFARRIRAMRSVVAWPFGSPTMTVRPPRAVTTSRSGTVSAV